MNRQGIAWLGATLVASFVLAGCQQGGQPGTSTGAAQGTKSVVSVERDIEAPEVFRMTAEGLWDGRPSLGGVWVAHADVKDPERVMIRNAANGKSVVGALFRRERDHPGPSLQVSSDAAESLGLLAGRPAELSIVALRREEKELPPPAEDVAEPEEAVVAAAPDAAEPAGEEIAVAAATDAASGAEPAAAPAKKKGGLFGLFRKKPKADPVLDTPVSTGVASGEIEAAPLESVTASAAAAIDRAEAGQAAPAAAASPALKRSYVQIGIFSTEANAGRAVNQVKAAGLTATVIAEKGEAKPYWRVIVGPAASVAERDALVSRVKGVGFPDAYPVTR